MNVHFGDAQRIRYAPAQNSQLLKTQLTAISNIISNGICAADTVNKTLKSRCSTDNKWRIPMCWLGNISHPKHIPKSETRLPLPGTFCSVFCPIILTAKKATAVLYQDTQRSWATPRQGHGAEQAPWTHPKVHRSGCPRFPLGQSWSALLSSWVYAGWHTSLSYPEVISYRGVLSNEWREGTALPNSEAVPMTTFHCSLAGER